MRLDTDYSLIYLISGLKEPSTRLINILFVPAILLSVSLFCPKSLIFCCILFLPLSVSAVSLPQIVSSALFLDTATVISFRFQHHPSATSLAPALTVSDGVLLVCYLQAHSKGIFSFPFNFSKETTLAFLSP